MLVNIIIRNLETWYLAVAAFHIVEAVHDTSLSYPSRMYNISASDTITTHNNHDHCNITSIE